MQSMSLAIDKAASVGRSDRNRLTALCSLGSLGKQRFRRFFCCEPAQSLELLSKARSTVLDLLESR